MAYSRSIQDGKNFGWFEHDKTVNSLKSISISKGSIRGLNSINVNFLYPITAFVGENGAGKSTILALIACAFHNNSAFIPQNRLKAGAKKQRGYYTYSDFFTFLSDENGISDLEIISKYHSKDGIIKSDTRRKKPSGKWNDYNSRPKRVVTFLGINRIVPPSESSTHCNYCRYFKKKNIDESQLGEIQGVMTRILGRDYSGIELKEFKTYKLFKAIRGELKYTGFNMGAGENAIFSLFLEILRAGKGALIIVDEIELGLHAQAQIRLIKELKKICNREKCQIIFSTHSKEVLKALPPEARIFIKRSGQNVDIVPAISAEYAFGKLSGDNSSELSVFVEDTVGKAFLENSLPYNIRERIKIVAAGSHQAVLKHIAVHYREGDLSFIAFLDGDMRSKKERYKRDIFDLLEDRITHEETEFYRLLDERLQYIPGESWPEKVLIEEIMDKDLSQLTKEWGDISDSELKDIFEEALSSGKHNEFFTISQKIHLPKEQIRSDIIKIYKETHESEVKIIEDSIREILDS